MPCVNYELEVYTYQIDFAGHVSNIVYHEWMEIGRLELLKAAGMPVQKLMEQGQGPVLAETHIRYLSPCYLGEKIQAAVWIAELSTASAWLEFLFQNSAGEVKATGRQRGLFVDLKTRKPQRFPRESQAAFAEFMTPPPSRTSPQS